MQYREIKAQEAQQATQPKVEQPIADVKETPKQTETKVETKPIETPKPPEKITIDGVGDVTLEELKKGYMRQNDYTQKTQDVSRQKKELQDAATLYETLKNNPQIVQELKKNMPVPQAVDPTMKKVTELENKMFDMMLQNEISILSNKYKDFEVREVLEMAKEKQTTNLEDAYLLVKARKQTPTDVESLKNQLRQEIIKELANDKEATSTIISSNDNQPVVQDNKPQLSEGEKRVARMMKMSEADYLKWRDIDSRNKIKK
jgi:hypothetical protein